MKDSKVRLLEGKLNNLFKNIGVKGCMTSIAFFKNDKSGVSFVDADKVRLHVHFDGWEYVGVSTPFYFASHWKELLIKPYIDYCTYLAQKTIEK